MVIIVSYDKLWKLMKAKNVSGYALINKHGFSNATLFRMKKGRSVTITIIDDLCRILECQPGDILEYFPDEEKRA